MTHQIREPNGHHKRTEHHFEDRSPEEIQRELEATRREMAHTINAIEEELSSRQLMIKAVDYLRGGPLRFSENFAQTVVNNPIPVALIGVGLVMLARADAQGSGLRVSGETGERLRDKLSRTSDRARSAMSHTKEKAHDIKEKAHELKERAQGIGEKARDLKVRSGDRVRRSIGTAQRAWHENPMMVGLVAIAAGAALAAAIPTTRREREVIGPRRDRLVGEVKRTAQSAVEGAKSGVKSGVESVQSEHEVAPIDEPLTSDLRPEDYPVR